NIYGYNTCGNDSICLAGLWRKAGLTVAPARLVGHCVSQVFYEGGWHLMDGDMHSIYLLRDNQTVAGEQDLGRDHDMLRCTLDGMCLHLDEGDGMVLPVHDGGIKPVIGRLRHRHPSFPQMPSLLPMMRVVVRATTSGKRSASCYH